MLLSDGCPNTVEDLRVYESGILDVAHAEGIDLKTKLGLAAEEVSEDVLDFLVVEGRGTDPFAASSSSFQAGDRRQRGVGDVVVTRQLQRWHALHSVALVYRDAFHNQLNARYEAQYRDYRRLSQEARDQTTKFGIGVVGSPVARPQRAMVTQTSASVSGATYFIKVSWVDAAGREGAASEVTALDVPDGQKPVISTETPPAGVVGYNVFVGLTETSLAKQNTAPIATGDSYSTTAGDLLGGASPGTGQEPDFYVTGARLLRRG